MSKEQMKEMQCDVHGVQRFNKHSFGNHGNHKHDKEKSQEVNKDEIFVPMTVNGSAEINMKLDSGAQVNVSSDDEFHIVRSRAGPLRPTQTRLFGYGGVPLRILGLTTLQCQYKEVSKSFDFIVVDHDDVHSPPVLGLKACREMGLIQVVLTITNSPDCESASREILKEFKDVFQGIGCIEDEYCIKIEENAVPVVHAVRRGPLALDKNIHKELQRMEDLGVICKVDEPTSWYFDPKTSVTLETDASQNGVGAVRFQDKGPVAFASKAMTNSQRNYAQIEKEMLAVLFGYEKFHYYLFGRNFKVRTDHKPLEVVFKKPLHAIPVRLQRSRMRLQIYDADVEFTPGKDVPVADMLSRHFIESSSNKDDLSLDEDIQSYVHMVTSNLPVSDKKMKEIRKESSEDSQHLMLMKIIMNGWPQNLHDCPSSIKEFWTFRDELTVIDGIVYKGDKIVIPISMRKEMLERIHTGHMGIVKCKERARDDIFWPRMTADIERTVDNCGTCQQNRMKQCKEPMTPSEVPKLP
ncbi:uncharacterized protein K02A2.6-like [Haliotis rubra]|uniref:uncharacterized protein K02A2.6-like n=1 Tax=Haliotis rubra TaxID=36100 RepID=UPI001EE5473C|nr:uncharacterized protein K02A2.6-like [Haliotis rubra]